MPGSPILDIEGPLFNTGLGVGQDYVYVPDVTALRGNNSIEALTTVGLSLKTLIIVSIDDKFSAWKLVSGNADGLDPNNQVQPADYDATTNDVFWLNTGSFENGIRGIHVTRATAQNVPTGVDTAISFDTARVNTTEFNEVANPTRFVCDVPGMYAIAGSVSFAANASGYRKAFIKKNGGAYIAADVQPANGSGSTVVRVSTLAYLMTGDYLELVVNQSSGAGLDVQKTADYSPEFSVIWLGNPVAEARSNFSSNDSNFGTPPPPTPSITQVIEVTDVGWYRIFEGTVPAVGGFTLQRLDAADGGLVDLDAAFAVTGAPDTGVVQVSKNVMNPALQGMDTIRVSYQDTNAYVDVHLNLAGTWTLVRPNKLGYVDAPYIVPTAGTGGAVSFNITPNSVGSTEPIDVPQVNADGIKIAKRGVGNWISPTGTASRTDFDPTTVTTEELAKRVTALILDELEFGSIREGLPSSMIYTDMLALANNLVEEGTSLNITDIFRITAAPDTSIEGIYVPAGTANGHTLYKLQGYESEPGDVHSIKFNGGTQWEIFDGAGAVIYRSNAPASPAEPWNTTQWEDTTPVNVSITTVAPNIPLTFNVLTDTHTAVYVHNDDGDASLNGVYLYTDDFNGKRRYYQENGANSRRIEWTGPIGLTWIITDAVSGTLFFSNEDVAYPDEVTTWIPGTGSGTATAQRMDAIDIASGVSISGGGADMDGIYIPQLGIYNANQTIYRRLDGTRFLNPDSYSWWITNEAGGFGITYARSDSFGIFPWQAAWTSFVLVAQEKNVAGPTNWHV